MHRPRAMGKKAVILGAVNCSKDVRHAGFQYDGLRQRAAHGRQAAAPAHPGDDPQLAVAVTERSEEQLADGIAQREAGDDPDHDRERLSKLPAETGEQRVQHTLRNAAGAAGDRARLRPPRRSAMPRPRAC